MTTEAAGPGLREVDPELQKMLRDLRERGCKRDEPCGVHDTPLWTCGLCLHNVLERVEDAHIRAALAEAGLMEGPYETEQSRPNRGSVNSTGDVGADSVPSVVVEQIASAGLREVQEPPPARASLPLRAGEPQ